MKQTAFRQTGRVQTGVNTVERPITSNKGANYSRTLGKDPKEIDSKINNKFR